MSNVISLADRTNNGDFADVPGTLREAQQMVETGWGAFGKGKKMVIVCLDTNGDDGTYHVSQLSCGMKRSEIVALLTYAQADILRDMLP